MLEPGWSLARSIADRNVQPGSFGFGSAQAPDVPGPSTGESTMIGARSAATARAAGATTIPVRPTAATTASLLMLFPTSASCSGPTFNTNRFPHPVTPHRPPILSRSSRRRPVANDTDWPHYVVIGVPRAQDWALLTTSARPPPSLAPTQAIPPSRPATRRSRARLRQQRGTSHLPREAR